MSDAVPLSDDVAVVMGCAESAQGRPKVLPSSGPASTAPVVLSQIAIRYVDPLHDLGVAHCHVGIGRRIRNAVVGEAVAHTKDVQADGIVRGRRRCGPARLDPRTFQSYVSGIRRTGRASW